MISSAFSHFDVAHLTGNMVSLLTFAPKIEKRMGNRKFSFVYVASIYASKLFDTLVYRPQFQVQGIISKTPGSLGASGAIAALIAYYAISLRSLTFRKSPFRLGYLHFLCLPLMSWLSAGPMWDTVHILVAFCLVHRSSPPTVASESK